MTIDDTEGLLQDVVEIIASSVGQHPDRSAIMNADGTTVTYGQLWESATELLGRLTIQAGELVGICMSRGTGVVTAMLAVVRAGGVYCPLSPSDPEARTTALQERIGMRYVLSENASGSIDIADIGGPGRCLDARSGIDRPIYVMWTSGSTGDPKAAVIAHRGVVRLIRDRSFMDLDSHDRVAFASNPMFDATTWEVWATLGNGGMIVVINSTDLVNVDNLRHRIESTKVTRAFLTTSLFDMLATKDPSMFGGFRSIAVGGEPLRPHTIGAVLRSGNPPGELLNGYGPSECTTFATSHRITLADLEGVRIPLGRALLDTHLVIVGDDGRAVKPGDDGELWIAGDGVGLGYLGPNGIEQDHFVETAFSDGVHRRWYRSGDLARTNADGLIDCLGRIDRQVKIRGHRVEPAEIERHIAACPGIIEVAVVTDRSTSTARLLAFVIFDPEMNSNVATIRSKINSDLPAYMIPTRFIVVDELPKTPNGKLDSASLLAFASTDLETPATNIDSPLDPVLATVLDCVRLVIGNPKIGPEDDLWEAGLDSLAVVEAIDALSFSLDRKHDAIDFVKHPTAKQLAALDPGRHSESDSDVVIFNHASSADPIFIALGGGTSALGFRHMAAIPIENSRPIVVIEPRGLRSRRRSDQQIQSLAARVVFEVERRQPDGPIVLGGWSAGGVIATHATWILESRGREVRLVLFDTLFFVNNSRFRQSIYTKSTVTHLLSRSRSAATSSWHRVRRRSAIVRIFPSTETSEPRQERLGDQARMFWIQMRALRSYGAPPPLEAPVVHFHVRDPLAKSVVSSVLPKSVSFEVPGDHNSMFDVPNVSALVPLLFDWLAQTDPCRQQPPKS